MNQEDKQFMTQFMIVLGALVVFTIAMFFLARYLMAVNQVNYGPLIAQNVTHRIKPVGESTIEKVAEAAPAGGDSGQQQAPSASAKGGQQAAKSSGAAAGGDAQASGQQTFTQACASCHQSGAMGAPKYGDKADWAPRLKQGKQALYQNAITGIGAMPPKGGQTSLSDADVKAAVDYMVAAVSGGGGGQPATGGGKPAQKAQPAKAKVGPSIKVAAARGASLKSKSTYQTMCSNCHSSGALGAPMITDKAAWQARLAKGPQALYSSALSGIGAMPPKGGHPQLSDDQIKAAVDYIISQVSSGSAESKYKVQ